MRLYGAVSNKPTTLWSNTAAVAKLDLGAIPKEPLPYEQVYGLHRFIESQADFSHLLQPRNFARIPSLLPRSTRMHMGKQDAQV